MEKNKNTNNELVFSQKNLSKIFENIHQKTSNSIDFDFAWDIYKNQKTIGELFYTSYYKEWVFIKDNFPHQRKAYRIDFPIKEENLFIALFKAIDVELIKQH